MGIGAGLTPRSMASAEANTGGRFGLTRGSPQISQAIKAGWLRYVHRGQGKRPSVLEGAVILGGGDSLDGEGDDDWRERASNDPLGGGIPQLRHGGTGAPGE